MSANRLLRAGEAAALLRLSVWTVYAWARRGRLAPDDCEYLRVTTARYAELAEGGSR